MYCKGVNIFEKLPAFVDLIRENESGVSGFVTVQEFKAEIDLVKQAVINGEIDPCNFWKIIMFANNVHLNNLDADYYKYSEYKKGLMKPIVTDDSFVSTDVSHAVQTLQQNNLAGVQTQTTTSDQSKPSEMKNSSNSKIIVVVVAIIVITIAYFLTRKNG